MPQDDSAWLYHFQGLLRVAFDIRFRMRPIYENQIHAAFIGRLIEFFAVAKDLNDTVFFIRALIIKAVEACNIFRSPAVSLLIAIGFLISLQFIRREGQGRHLGLRRICGKEIGGFARRCTELEYLFGIVGQVANYPGLEITDPLP